MIRIGCSGFPVNKVRYQSQFQLVELTSPQKAFPRRTTVEKWRAQLAPPFEFVLNAPAWMTQGPRTVAKRGGPRPHHAFEDSSALRRAAFTLHELGEILTPRLILFELPASALPTPDLIGRMQQFFKHFRREKFTLVWDPPFHWPRTLVERLSSTLNLHSALNPLAEEIAPQHALHYFRVKRHSRKEGFAALTDRELELIKGRCRARLNYVIFNHGPWAFKDALRFRDLCR